MEKHGCMYTEKVYYFDETLNLLEVCTGLGVNKFFFTQMEVKAKKSLRTTGLITWANSSWTKFDQNPWI